MVHRGSFGMPTRRAVLLLCLRVRDAAGGSARTLPPRRRRARRPSAYCSTPARPVSATRMASTAVVPSSRPPSRPPATRSTGRTAPTTAARATNCDNANKNPRIFTDDEPRPLRRDRSTERVGRAARPLVVGRPEGVDHQVRPERRRHRRHPQRDRHGHHRRRRGTGGTATTPTPSSARRCGATRRPTSTTSRRSRSRTTTTSPRATCRTRTRSATSTTTSTATSAATTTCSPRSTSAPTRPAATPWARTTRSRGASSTTATTSTTAPATPKTYSDGRTWVTSMGHFGASYTENGGNNNFVKMIVGGVRWVAGEGRKSDCSGTVWSSFTRTVVVARRQQPDRHRRRQGRQGLLVGDRQPDQPDLRRAT